MSNSRKRLSHVSFLAKAALALFFLVMGYAARSQNNKDFKHWANDPKAMKWINGDLNKINSTYQEGDIVPHVYVPADLTLGDHIVTIVYDYYQQSHNSGGFLSFIPDAVPPKNYYSTGAISSQDVNGTTFYTQGLTINSFTEGAPFADNGGNYFRTVTISYTFNGGNAAIYFGLLLAKANEVTLDPPADTKGAGSWAGSSLNVKLTPDSDPGARTLSINLDETIPPCTPVTNTGDGFTLCVGATKQLDNANAGTWTSSNENVATVVDGLVTAVASGAATITNEYINDDGCLVTTTFAVEVQDYTTTPTINAICPGSVVTGTAAAGATVVVTSSGGQTATVTYPASGTWSATFTPALVAGDVVTATASESGKCDASNTSTVNSTPTGTLSYQVPLCKPLEGPATIAPTLTPTNNSGPFTNVSYSATTVSGSGSLSINPTTGVIDLVASAPGTYAVTAQFTGANGCPGSAATTITLNLCASSFTQGFWGGTTGNGKDCAGKTVQDILTGFNLATSPEIVGSATKYLKLNDAAKTRAIMPGGSYSQNVFDKKYILQNPAAGESLLSGSKFVDSKTGKLVSVVISQTIALALNLRYDARLGDIAFESGKNILNTKAITYSSGCTVGSVSSTSTSYTMSGKVLCYLQNNAATYSFNVKGLLKLANNVIGGSLDVSTGSPFSFSELVQTLDAINKGFDKGAQLVNYAGSYQCTLNAITQRSIKGSAGVDQAVIKSLAVSTYPNPFTSKVRFTLQAPKAGKAVLELYNMMGQKLAVPFEGFLNANESRNIEYTVPVNSRSSLIYRLSMNGEQVSGKLMNTKE